MASITIKLASGTSGKLYATASGLMNTASTQPSSSITISCTATGVTGATVTLKEATDGSQITNCPMMTITWTPGGYAQTVLFGSTTSGKPMAQFKYGSTTISYASTTVSDGGTITVTAIQASGTVDSTAPSDIGIGGYYYAHNGRGGRYNYSDGVYTYEEYTTVDANQGIRSVPARCGNKVPVDISFKYNGTAKYFIYMLMRGWSGSSAGCPGDMGMLTGSGPIVSSTFQSGWGNEFTTYRMDVFSLSSSGIYPSLAAMPTDGPSTSTCPSNSTWITWPADSSLSMHSVKYYATNGSTILRSNTEAKLDLDFEKVSGSAITFYKGDEIYKYLSGDSGTLVIPSGKRFKGWQKKQGSGNYGNVITTASGLGKVGSSDVSLKLVIEDNNVDITFNANGGTVGGSATTTKSWLIGSTQTLLTPTAYTKNGYTVTFAGWYTSASGGTKVGDAGASYTVPSSNKTLYAHWTESAITYTATFKPNTGKWHGDSTGTDKSSRFTVNDVLAAPDYVTKIGYDFTGWKITSRAGSWVNGTNYYTSATSTKITGASGQYGNVTFTAQFNLHTYRITYNLGDDSVTNPNPSTYTIEDENILLQDPTREGYQFLGWSPVGYIEAGSTGNKTFTANWFKVPGDFTPKPGHNAEENEYFGIDINAIDDTKYYQLILELNGDRDQYPYEYTEGIDYSKYGIDTENNKWTYDSGIVTGEELKQILRGDVKPYIFPMDIWRCRIHHSSGKLNVTLNLYESVGSPTPIGSVTVSKDFNIESENKPRITKLTLHEGVVNIKNLDLGANNQESTKRFVGNKKSSVLATIYASNKSMNGKELLYEAVPCQFIVRLDGVNTGRSDASWDSGDVERILTSEQIAGLVASYNSGEMEYPCEDILITEDPFPSINSDLPNARLRIKIWDSRRE